MKKTLPFFLMSIATITSVHTHASEGFDEFPSQDVAHCLGWAAGIDAQSDFGSYMVELTADSTVSIMEDPKIMEEFGVAMGYSEAMIEFKGATAAQERYALVCNPIKAKYGF